MYTLTERLNALWESVIKGIDIDILSNCISIDLEIIEMGNCSKHSIIFKDVSAYFYINNNGENRLNLYKPEEGEYLELTTVNFFEENIEQIRVKSAVETWANQYFASANFVLEIWSKVLFIEAKIVIVDGIDYCVKT